MPEKVIAIGYALFQLVRNYCAVRLKFFSQLSGERGQGTGAWGSRFFRAGFPKLIWVICLLTMVAGAFADSLPLPDIVLLKPDAQNSIASVNGQISCAIISEDDQTLVINRSAVRGIIDKAEIPKSAILEIKRGEPGERDYAVIKDSIQLPEDSKEVRYYQDILDQKVTPFLAQYPQGKYAEIVAAQKQKFLDEVANLQQGRRRIGDTWYTAAEYDEAKPDIETKQLIRFFGQFQKPPFPGIDQLMVAVKTISNYQSSQYYPDLVEAAISAIGNYSSQMNVQTVSDGLQNQINAALADIGYQERFIISAINVPLDSRLFKPPEGGAYHWRQEATDNKWYADEECCGYPYYNMRYTGYPEFANYYNSTQVLKKKLPDSVLRELDGRLETIAKDKAEIAAWQQQIEQAVGSIESVKNDLRSQADQLTAIPIENFRQTLSLVGQANTLLDNEDDLDKSSVVLDMAQQQWPDCTAFRALMIKHVQAALNDAEAALQAKDSSKALEAYQKALFLKEKLRRSSLMTVDFDRRLKILDETLSSGRQLFSQLENLKRQKDFAGIMAVPSEGLDPRWLPLLQSAQNKAQEKIKKSNELCSQSEQLITQKKYPEATALLDQAAEIWPLNPLLSGDREKVSPAPSVQRGAWDWVMEGDIFTQLSVFLVVLFLGLVYICAKVVDRL